MTQDPASPSSPQPDKTARADPPTDPPMEPTEPPADPQPARVPSRFQLMIGRDLVALGFLLVAAVFVVAIAFLGAATDIATVVAPVTTLVGTLIGAVFGVQVGNEGRERESIARRGAETRAAQAAALVEPERGERLVEMWRNSTANGNPGEEAF